MGPERIAGQPYSFACDVWSFGLSLLAVAMGRYPYDTQGGYWALLQAIIEQPVPLPAPISALSQSESLPPPPQRINSDSFHPSASLRDFLSQACSKDPALRPSARQLLNHSFLRVVMPDRSAVESSTLRLDCVAASEESASHWLTHRPIPVPVPVPDISCSDAQSSKVYRRNRPRRDGTQASADPRIHDFVQALQAHLLKSWAVGLSCAPSDPPFDLSSLGPLASAEGRGGASLRERITALGHHMGVDCEELRLAVMSLLRSLREGVKKAIVVSRDSEKSSLHR